MKSLLRKRKVVEVSEELVRNALMKPRFEEAPKLLDSDTNSVDSDSVDHAPGPWSKPYEPPPVVNQSTIILIGAFVFVLAMIWPPLILFFSYLISKLIPYSCRVNDDASKRRQLFAEFSRDEDQPENFRHIPDHIELKESYWINQRYVSRNEHCPSILTESRV